MREKRPSSWIFILAAVGYAAGLGNLWRFPMLAYEFGGAAFIVALIIAKFVIVYPLVMTETVVGQKFASSGPKSFNKIFRGSAWIQRLPVIAGIFILMYYVPIMSRGVNYFFTSWSGNFLADPAGYFASNIIGQTGSIEQLGGIRRGMLGSLLLSFGLIVAAMRNGLKSSSKVLKWTVLAPIVLLGVLGIRGVTLPGAGIGIQELFIPDRSQLLNIELWQAAIGQTFFSTGLAMGYFFLSGSYREEKTEIPRSTFFVLAGDLFVSILAGVAVFGTLGFMAQNQGVPFAEAAASGPSLIFEVFPTAISMMPGFVTGFAVILFAIVVMLGLSSVIGMVDIVVGAFMDLREKYDNLRLTMLQVVGILFLGSLPFATGAGIYYLDIVNHFVGGYIFMVIGMLEALVIAWKVGPNTIRRWINETTVSMHIRRWFVVVLYAVPGILAAILGVSFYHEFVSGYDSYPWWALAAFGRFPLVVTVGASFVLNRFTEKRDQIFSMQQKTLPVGIKPE